MKRELIKIGEFRRRRWRRTARHLGQKIAGHASEEMTKNYQKDHAEVVWSEAVPDLDISEIAG
jgi:hypothetical protein